MSVIAGTGSNSTQECVEYSKKAESLGVDAILVVGPYYNKPTNKGMYLHFSTVAKAVDVPIILYNVPSRTGSKIAIDVVIQLANDFENIVGIKDATGDLTVAAELLARRPKGFKVYSRITSYNVCYTKLLRNCWLADPKALKYIVEMIFYLPA